MHCNWKPFCTEPVGSVGPKVNIADKLNTALAAKHQVFSLGCPSQAYPVPVFR